MRVLITGESPIYENLKKSFSGEGVEIISHSFIHTQLLNFEEPLPACRWIFLGSPRAVQAVLHNKIDLGKYFVAVAGKGTKAALPENIKARFIARSTAMHEEALRLKVTIGHDNVFIPHASRSNLTFASVIPEHQQKKVIAYTTTPMGDAEIDADVVVFTSPSNIEGYLLKNKILPEKKYIAFGETTEAFLKTQKIPVFITLQEISDAAIARAIKSAISGF